jgi:hypothetical protein
MTFVAPMPYSPLFSQCFLWPLFPVIAEMTTLVSSGRKVMPEVPASLEKRSLKLRGKVGILSSIQLPTGIRITSR